MTRVLILDGSIYPDIYAPTRQWRDLMGDVPSDSVHLPSGEQPPDPRGYTHLVVTGSEASIVVARDWYDAEARVVREAVDAGLAVLGSCFGHQMLALALGCSDHVRRSPEPELGWIEVEVTGADELLEGVGPSWNVFASHFDEVVELPAPWRVLARTRACGVHVMRFGDRPVWGIQAHPEIPPPQARLLLEGLAQRMPERRAEIERALAGRVRDDGAARTIVERFLVQKGG
jgi:GMP synthase-like glutamine amidotransferase